MTVSNINGNFDSLNGAKYCKKAHKKASTRIRLSNLIRVRKYPKLTSNYHHDYGEHLFVVRLGRDVTKTNRCHAGHGEVEGRNVHGPFGGTSNKFAGKSHVLVDGLEGGLADHGV